MGEETFNTTNLTPNLGPVGGAGDTHATNEIVYVNRRTNESIRLRDLACQRTRPWGLRDHVPIPRGPGTVSTELNQTMDWSGNLSSLQVGEGSVAAEDGRNEAPKACEMNKSFVEDETTERMDASAKTDCEDGSFFDCNICLDLAKDPVVTCCGHLFCWGCLYRWLRHHSRARECPVCKGEATFENVTPIYGRGNNNRAPEEEGKIKIPVRPQARKVKNLREAIRMTGNSCPIEDIARHHGNRSNLTRDLVHRHESEDPNEILGSALSRMMTSSGRRMDGQTVLPPENVVDLTQGEDVFGSGTAENTRLRPPSRQLLRINIPSPLPGFGPAMPPFLARPPFLPRPPFPAMPPFLAMPPFVGHLLIDPNAIQTMPVDNRYSFSRMTGVNSSENQIDLRVNRSSSSARGINDLSRVLNIDSRDSPPPRRRRFN